MNKAKSDIDVPFYLEEQRITCVTVKPNQVKYENGGE